MFNRIYNVKNPYQGKTKKVLCVCSAGLLRSPTAANVLHREYGYNTRAVGVFDYALIILDDVHCYWADEIVVVDKDLASYIPEKFQDIVTILDIPDTYSYMDKELQEIIIEQYENTSS
jgi:predicted protein tyrosine phosphatase